MAQLCKQQDRSLHGLGHRSKEHSSAHFDSVKFSDTKNGCECQETVARHKASILPLGGETVKEDVWEEKHHAEVRKNGNSRISISDDVVEFREKKERLEGYNKEGLMDKVKHLLPGHKHENCESVRIEKVAEKKHGGWLGKEEDCSESVTVKHVEEKKHGGSRC